MISGAESVSRMGLCSFVLFSVIMLTTSRTAEDTIALNQSIRDGESIVSEDGNFELGFFSPGSSKNRYLGIWFKKSPGAVVWVANRETPLTDTSGELRFNSDQSLLLLNVTKGVVWSSNSSGSVSDPVVQLLSIGNLVIKNKSDRNEENFVWQSFDYPGDTYLLGMKLGKNFVTGRETRLTSWKSSDDPSPGEYNFWLFIKSYVQLYKTKGSVIESRVGPWMGTHLAGWDDFRPNPIFTYKQDVIINKKEVYYKAEYYGSVLLQRGVLTHDGRLEFLHLDTQILVWRLDFAMPSDTCGRYGLCGTFGSCGAFDLSRCGCLEGFEPTRAEEWNHGNWSSGCQRKVLLNCDPGEGFRKFSRLKLPDTIDSWFNENMSLDECATACKNNCSCTAYANPLATGDGKGCLLWFGDLIDIRDYQKSGQDLYLRLAASELLANEAGSNRTKRMMVKILLLTSAMVVLLVLTMLIFYIWRRKKFQSCLEVHTKAGNKKEDFELPLFSFPEVVRATNNFSIDNKLGEGGFGPVYKGVLETGEEVAIKRLSETSKQGSDEFINEATCIAQLQHRNLVKLLGYCIQGDEKILIYEYMPNKSLDLFIFGDVKESLLNWPQRFSIIHGIARGLLYLHQDSRLRIIHRDLKAGNILLDLDFNAKISDFGVARMLSGREETKTTKVVGTLGYISPEYARNGYFSVKSDIFSFGVLVLEIISGKKNRYFSNENHTNLIGHAWELHEEGKSLELADTSLHKSWVVSEVLQSVHVGLLCVQQNADHRPSMSSVIHMLDVDVSLPPPNQPGFFTQESNPITMDQAFDSTPSQQISVNEITITQLGCR